MGGLGSEGNVTQTLSRNKSLVEEGVIKEEQLWSVETGKEHIAQYQKNPESSSPHPLNK